MASYPYSLPAPTVSGYGVAPVDKTLRTEMDSGAARVRRRTRAQLDMVDVTWRLRASEMAAFRAWHESATNYNLVPSSQEFSGAGWSKTNTTITAGATAAPDGGLADKLVETATASVVHAVSRSPVIAVAGQSYGASVYLKAAERSWANISMSGAFGGGGAFVDLANGVFGNVNAALTARLIRNASGWVRVEISRAAAASGTAGLEVYTAPANGTINYTGAAGSGLFVWGSQINPGKNSLPYLPTAATNAIVGIDFGVEFFNIPLHLGNDGPETRLARFVGPYKAQAIGAGPVWSVTAQLEVR